MTIQSCRYLLLTIRRESKAAGFTLMELLVSIIVSAIVTSGLLYLVNEVVRVDRREARLESVQRDMQRAMDYMTDDLREAVYVYSTPTTITSQLTASDLPTGPSGTASVPVLAFWKPEYLTASESGVLDSVNCASLSDPIDEACAALKLRQSYYSLVVYFTLANTQSDSNSNWDGQARIIRYRLPQYTSSAITPSPGGTAPTFAQTPGFSLPNNSFEDWAPASGTTNGDWDVLVDFVDAPTSSFGALTPNCDEFGANYQMAPSTSTSNSFKSCISLPGTVTAGANQEVVVLLRGSAITSAQAIANSVSSSVPNQSVLPTLKSRVLVRGAANKNPN